MEIYVKISLIAIFSFFLVFNHDFIIYIAFANIVASNTAIDDIQISSHTEYLIQT